MFLFNTRHLNYFSLTNTIRFSWLQPKNHLLHNWKLAILLTKSSVTLFRLNLQVKHLIAFILFLSRWRKTLHFVIWSNKCYTLEAVSILDLLITLLWHIIMKKSSIWSVSWEFATKNMMQLLTFGNPEKVHCWFGTKQTSQLCHYAWNMGWLKHLVSIQNSLSIKKSIVVNSIVIFEEFGTL